MRFHRALFMLLSLLVAAVFAASAHAQPAQPAAPERHAARRKPAPRPAASSAKPRLLGQYGDWGAYTASPAGKKICFAIARPSSAETKPPNRPRDQPYMFVTTRPDDNVTNEVSVAVGYPFKASSEATAAIGSTTFALYTQGDGAWIKNTAEQTHMIDAMRAGDTIVIKGESSRGTQTTDTYSLKGLTGALDRVAQECK